jgi:hypothetical protein
MTNALILPRPQPETPLSKSGESNVLVRVDAFAARVAKEKPPAFARSSG